MVGKATQVRGLQTAGGLKPPPLPGFPVLSNLYLVDILMVRHSALLTRYTPTFSWFVP